MTRNLFNAAALILAVAGIGACATTPNYATRAGYTPPPAIKPHYAVRAGALPPPLPPATQTPMVEDAATPAPAPTAPVESQSLPPVAATQPPPDAVPPPPAQLQAAAPAASDPASQTVASADPDPAPAAAQSTAEDEPQAAASESQPARPPRMRPGPPRLITTGKVVEAHGVFRDYEVRKHDHIDAIAREIGTTRKVIVDENHLKAPYAIKPGQVLRVPVAKAYVVESGDTLKAVGKRFGVGADDLATLNHISMRKDLRPGQQLALPADFKDHGPTRLRGAMVADTRAEPSPARLSRRELRERARETAAAQPEPHFAHEGPAVAAQPPARYANEGPAPQSRLTPMAPRAMTPEQTYAYAPPREAQRGGDAASEAASGPSPADISTAARGRFIWPVHGAVLSAFGVKGVGRRNDGVDIGAPQGTVVLAAAGGDVVYAGDQVPGFGNLVLVKHADGWVTAYAHLDKVSVQMRQQVTQGEELGQVGMSGGVAQPQLHFEIRYASTPQDKAKPIDPILVLPR